MMNDYVIISNYLRNNPTYTFELGGYLLPKYLYNSTINLFSSREKELLNRSSYIKKFEDFLISNFKESNFDKISEFPIPIENRELWENILESLGINKNNRAWFTNYFKLDYLFPNLDCCVEIDSDYHFSRVNYDKARDMYLLNMYGLRTIRLLKFGENAKNIKINLQIFRDYVKDFISRKKFSKISLDFSKTITENYIYHNQDLYKIITRIRSDHKNIFISNKKLNIKLSDYIVDFPDLTNVNFQKRLILEFRLVFGREIIFEK